MSSIYLSDVVVPRTPRNKRIYQGTGGNGSVSSGAASAPLDWVTVEPDLVTINRNLKVLGQIEATEEIIAWVADAVSSSVLAGLTANYPLEKTTDSSVSLRYNGSQFEVNGSHQLQIIDGIFATLDESGKIPAGQLPSYVDDVLEYANLAAFPTPGESGKIYIAIDTSKSYRWGGSVYVEISSSVVLGETSTTAYRGDRGKTAYDYSQIGHVPLSDSRITQWSAAYGWDNWASHFGTGAGTIAQGNDSRINNGQTAYGWGNHAGLYSVVGHTHNNIIAYYANINDPISGISVTRQNTSDNGNYAYAAMLNVSTGDTGFQLQSNYGDSNLLHFRGFGYGSQTGGFGPWRSIWHDGNFNPANYQPLEDQRLSTGNSPTFNGVISKAPIILKNSSGVTKWTIQLGSSDELEFHNASGTLEAIMDQSGSIRAKGELTAYASI